MSPDTKPCKCCGREITPRAKFARNWDSIKYCSTQCRAYKSVVDLRTWLSSKGERQDPEVAADTINCEADSDDLAGSSELKAPRAAEAKEQDSRKFLIEDCPTFSRLGRCLESNGYGRPFLYLDAWVEACILDLALRAPTRSSKQSLRTLSDVSQTMHAELEAFSAPSDSLQDEHKARLGAAVSQMLEKTAPGEREIIRRAARRLAIFEAADWAYTTRFDAFPRRLVLTQNRGRKVLTSLSDVSFAKGDIEISCKT